MVGNVISSCMNFELRKAIVRSRSAARAFPESRQRSMAACPTSLKVLLLAAAVSCANSERTPLHFLYIYADSPSYNSTGAIPAMDIALENINGDSSLLPGYTLNYTQPLDSKVSRKYCLLNTSRSIYFLHCYLLWRY